MLAVPKPGRKNTNNNVHVTNLKHWRTSLLSVSRSESNFHLNTSHADSESERLLHWNKTSPASPVEALAAQSTRRFSRTPQFHTPCKRSYPPYCYTKRLVWTITTIFISLSQWQNSSAFQLARNRCKTRKLEKNLTKVRKKRIYVLVMGSLLFQITILISILSVYKKIHLDRGTLDSIWMCRGQGCLDSGAL